MKKTLLLGCLLVSLLIPQTASAGEGAQQIVKIAQQELKRGVVEKPYGSNRGPRIRMYGLATTPRLYPAPWCAYFASWVTRQAGLPIGPGGRGLGYVPYIQAWAKKTKKWRSSPRAGDLITFPHHVGIVEPIPKPGCSPGAFSSCVQVDTPRAWPSPDLKGGECR